MRNGKVSVKEQSQTSNYPKVRVRAAHPGAHGTMVEMARVRVEPAGFEFEAPLNETVMDAANAAGYFWPVGCNRNGECTNCAMEVFSGVGRLSGMGRFERANLIRQRGARSVEDPRIRLACQARVLGDVVVYKSGVRPDTI